MIFLSPQTDSESPDVSVPQVCECCLSCCDEILNTTFANMFWCVFQPLLCIRNVFVRDEPISQPLKLTPFCFDSVVSFIQDTCVVRVSTITKPFLKNSSLHWSREQLYRSHPCLLSCFCSFSFRIFLN
jgi:hypothetical protein